MAAAETARERLAPLEEEDTLSLGERAYRRLRESIVQGMLPAGRKISERSIATELGISAQPVREALQRLEQDGMVVTLPRRGTVVADVSSAQLAELGRIRAALPFGTAHLARERKVRIPSDQHLAQVKDNGCDHHAPSLLFRAYREELGRIWERMERHKGTSVPQHAPSGPPSATVSRHTRSS